ncbi:MAG: hypothetical protein K0Q49_934 [Haloplasmataceae bacterium]|jgi:hypothetical protein|nr:hypothetical protein [Haloplasmataceae bacterium]
MTEKIGEILFHPSTLIKYKDTHFFKVLLYLLILTLLTSIVPIIETLKFTGYTYANKTMIEEIYSIDFSDINNVPSCKVENNKLYCVNTSEIHELGSIYDMFTVVIDVEGKMKANENKFYIRLTENNIKISDKKMNYIIIGYDELPTSWQSFDLEAIKKAQNPEEEYFNLVVGGINELKKDFIGYEIFTKIIVMFILLLLEILFYSILFYLLIGRKMYKFKEVFKVSVFAYTLPVVIGLFFSLLNMQVLNSTLLAIITIIYMHIALMSNQIHKDDPENKE